MFSFPADYSSLPILYESLLASAVVEHWPIVEAEQPLAVLRLDRLVLPDCPEVDGNKLFKLLPNLIEARERGAATLLSFGGRWSNHLWSLSAAAAQLNLPAHGVVNGSATAQLTPTLCDARNHGMQLHFIPRRDFAGLQWCQSMAELEQSPLATLLGPKARNNGWLIPTGGANISGLLGAYLLGRELLVRYGAYRWLVAAGSGTLATGLALARAVAAFSQQGAISDCNAEGRVGAVVAVSVAEPAERLLERNLDLLWRLAEAVVLDHVLDGVSDRFVDGFADGVSSWRRCAELQPLFSFVSLLYNAEFESGPRQALLDALTAQLTVQPAAQRFAGHARARPDQLVELAAAVPEDALEPVYLLPALDFYRRYHGCSYSRSDSVEKERATRAAADSAKQLTVGLEPCLLIHGGGLQAARSPGF